MGIVWLDLGARVSLCVHRAAGRDVPRAGLALRLQRGAGGGVGRRRVLCHEGGGRRVTERGLGARLGCIARRGFGREDGRGVGGQQRGRRGVKGGV